MKGGSIMKRNIVWGVLAGIGLVALSTTVAQASGGGRPFPLTSFFVCNSINGDDAGLVVDIELPFIGPVRSGIRIGSGALACAVAKLFLSPRISCSANSDCPLGTSCFIPSEPPGNTTGTCEIEPNSLVESPFQQLKCYSVTVSPRNSGSPPPSYTAEDWFFPFFPDEANDLRDKGVQDSGIQYICAPALFTR
jgi:hypothetical protein